MYDSPVEAAGYDIPVFMAAVSSLPRELASDSIRKFI
jgi:hypothetical protein